MRDNLAAAADEDANDNRQPGWLMTGMTAATMPIVSELQWSGRTLVRVR